MSPVAVVWTPNAILCLRRLYSFMAEKDKKVAQNAMALIFDKVKKLSEFPCIGRPAKDLEPEYRELLIPFGIAGYVVLYRYDKESGVAVLAIKHQLEAGY